jgi:RNA:NAD 2'-phosphotransferase (TPT1/KptA family)
MKQVKVNLTLDQEVWHQFATLVPSRKKSKIINQLLREEIDKIARSEEKKRFAAAFQAAAKDKQRLKSIKEWEALDSEGWD